MSTPIFSASVFKTMVLLLRWLDLIWVLWCFNISDSVMILSIVFLGICKFILFLKHLLSLQRTFRWVVEYLKALSLPVLFKYPSNFLIELNLAILTLYFSYLKELFTIHCPFQQWREHEHISLLFPKRK